MFPTCMKLCPVRSSWVEAAPSVLNIRIHEHPRRVVVLATLALVASFAACGGSGSKAGVSGSSVINTFAGSTNSGFGGDGGPATQAQLNQPVAAAFDSSGNMFLADTGHHRDRKST